MYKRQDENEAGDAEDADWFGGQSPVGSPSGVGTGAPAASGPGVAANAGSADMHLANQVFGNNTAAMAGIASTAAATAVAASQYGSGAALAGGAGYPGFSNANPYFGMQPGAYGMSLGVTGLVPAMTAEAELNAIRGFLRSVGVDEEVLRGSLAELRGYVRWRMS